MNMKIKTEQTLHIILDFLGFLRQFGVLKIKLQALTSSLYSLGWKSPFQSCSNKLSFE